LYGSRRIDDEPDPPFPARTNRFVSSTSMR
jgi:hypothetical protein